MKYEDVLLAQTRRQFLSRTARGIGSLALAGLLNRAAMAGTGEGQYGLVVPRHHLPTAKRVIYLYMAGGPSHLETLDYKPKLVELDGQPMPESVTQGQPIAQL
jgi:hypothetical protein